MKLPEPIAYKHYARKKPELSVLSWASRPTERQIATGFVTEALLTEAQCKQMVRDALEAAAKVCDTQVNEANQKGEAAKTDKARDCWSAVAQTAHASRTAIRNMAKEIV